LINIHDKLVFTNPVVNLYTYLMAALQAGITHLNPGFRGIIQAQLFAIDEELEGGR
jgi:hypothetical protein